jgi:RND family efflux transporter MFP subunit
VTAWGERYEIFAETDALVAGRMATSNVHVTVLDGSSPLTTGSVSIVLRSPGGSREERFRQDQPKRDGIFGVEIEPSSEGTFDLAFVVQAGGDPEEVPAGRVRVGNAGSPGGLVEPPPETGGDISFLKEQQWQTDFATRWVEEGAIRESVSGPGRVGPARGAAVLLTASVDAVVAHEPWPYVGLDIASGAAVFRLRPRAAGRSLPELAADASALEAEAQTGRKRVERLTELLQLEATSAAELERARAALAGTEARLEAARLGLAVARGTSAGDELAVPAPWRGLVADVAVSPGQAVPAGAVLGRLVKPRPLWIEVALRPEDAPRLTGGVAGVILQRASLPEPLEIEGGAVRLVAIAPEVDPGTATLAATLEVDRGALELPIGSAVEAEIVLSGERPGIVVPRSSLVDDAGVAVAYVQDSGESFSRREVRVLARQGARLLVEGLRAGERLVTLGGAAIRRSTLLSSGAPEGHVH